MKYWNAEEALEYEHVQPVTWAVATTLSRSFKTHNLQPAPKMLYSEASECELMIELAPGVRLPVDLDYAEAPQIDNIDEGSQRVTSVAQTALDGVLNCMPRTEAIGDMLHDARVRVRRLLGGWHADRLPVRLLDIRLAPYNCWRGSDTPALVILLEVTDHCPTPRVVAVKVDDVDTLETLLVADFPDYAQAHAERGRLLSLGADGAIDQLALNALAIHGGLEQHLDRLLVDDCIVLPDDTCIVTVNGHVHGARVELNSPIQWSCGQMNVRSEPMTEERLKAAIGLPVSALYPHPLLSPDMIVIDAKCMVKDGIQLLSVKYSQTKKLFCFASGRVWDFPDEPAGNIW